MKTLISNLAILSLLLGGCADDNMEGMLLDVPGACFPQVADKYTYPVTPGMAEWRAAADMYELVQLPTRVLSSISTLGLIDALVQAPLFSGFYLLSSSRPIDTWHRHYERFNSATELFKRRDAGTALVKYYRAISLDCIEAAASDENFGQVAEYERIFGIEFLFTRQEILGKISHQDRQKLVEALLSNYEQKEDGWTTLVPVARIMLDDKYPDMVKYYNDNVESCMASIDSGYGFPKEQAAVIITFANSFINKK
jgi:hypothetical protein